ncbi:Alpha/Beta hydrolase protein [Elsinoe ampelina]|uniref:Carboxylic ester hydrolase n=1 Tax=Elsinoe ampelina TaxID=302913 RepID=A0A6A6GC70_9PEZI|nr:Alpha/Beta hydrolase protein [Elsinoe ampelina]
MKFSTVLSLLAVAGSSLAIDEVVNVDYTSYRGTTLSNGITQWVGMRYAAPPLGHLRFAAPQDPEPVEGVQDANRQGPICLGTGQNTNQSSEDCLYIAVYSPSNATASSNLPVFLYFQGGGFNTNSDPNLNGSGIIRAGEFQMVFVTLNYRVGPWGFLSGEEITTRASNNNGLKDQRKALEWVQKYICRFGGNPDHVVIGGGSAGGASVTLQLAAYNGSVGNLFHGTAASAQSFGRILTIPETQYQYDNLVIRTGCLTSNDTLTCLRSLNSTFLQSVNINTAGGGAPGSPLYMYSPVLDNDFLTSYTLSGAFATNRFPALPAIYGDSTNEGTIFAPRTTANKSDSATFLKNQYPTITLSQLRTIDALYAVAEQFPNSGAYWRQLSNAYGELRYICPGIFISRQYAARGQARNWNYRWNVVDPAANASGTGVAHTVEVNAIFGPDNVAGTPPASYEAGEINAEIGGVIQRFWANFIRNLDPNVGGGVGGVEWANWTEEQEGERRLLFQTDGAGMEGIGEQRGRCDEVLKYRDVLRQ